MHAYMDRKSQNKQKSLLPLNSLNNKANTREFE